MVLFLPYLQIVYIIKLLIIPFFKSNLPFYRLMIEELKISQNFLSDIITFESILIGVFIPISMQVVNWVSNKYKGTFIPKVFAGEILYKLQYYLLIGNISIAIYVKMVEISNKFSLSLLFIWFVINMVIFLRFVKLVEGYIVEPDKYLVKKLKRNIHAEIRK